MGGFSGWTLVLILGIETSCDETAAAVVADGVVTMAEELATQSGVHGKVGGGGPELACRGHVEMIDRVVERTLEKAGLPAGALDAIAVTAGPGLAGAPPLGFFFSQGVRAGPRPAAAGGTPEGGRSIACRPAGI